MNLRIKSKISFAVAVGCATARLFAAIPPPTAPADDVAMGHSSLPGDSNDTNAVVLVVIRTNLGDITVELNREKAPQTVGNFLRYVDSEFYDNTLFHRVIKNFMIQGGGFDAADFQRKDTRPPIPNESSNGLKNRQGTIAMARTQEPDSATSQFFINCKNNEYLDFRNKTPRGCGYAVFGTVVSGMDVVSEIERSATDRIMGMADVPVRPVIIKSIRRK